MENVHDTSRAVFPSFVTNASVSLMEHFTANRTFSRGGNDVEFCYSRVESQMKRFIEVPEGKMRSHTQHVLSPGKV